MKKMLRIPVKVMLSIIWLSILPFFVFGIVPLVFAAVFFCYVLDDNSESFWTGYKKHISDFWEVCSPHNLFGE